MSIGTGDAATATPEAPQALQALPVMSRAQFLLLVFSPLALGYLLSYLFRTINAALAPYLVSEFGLNASLLGLLTSCYLLAFGLMQLPLGMLIDRYGVRRVQGCTLLLASAGAAVFALADGVPSLMIGRALIGAGVAVSLMASVTTFVILLPPERVPMAFGCLMGFGGLGAMLAGAPVDSLIRSVGWRAIFAGLSIATIFVALAVLRLVPDMPRPGSSWSGLLNGLRMIYTTPLFWRIAPLAVMTCGTGFALQGLWAAPWLTDVARLGQPQVAMHLSVMAFGLLLGSIACGPLASVANRFGCSLFTLVGLLAVGFFGVLGLLAAGATLFALPLWFVFGFLMNPMSLTYVVLAQRFESGMAGRVNTAINVLVILGSFVIQAVVGGLLDLWGKDPGGYYPARAYAWAFGGLTVIGCVTLFWFALGHDSARDSP